MFKYLVFSFLCLFGVLSAESPSVLYLTWVHDPSSTMMVQWHTNKEDKDCYIYYKKKGEIYWQEKAGGYKRLTGYSVLVHSTELTDLEEDTEYSFRVGTRPTEYRFRTMPKKLTREVRFVVGGDAYLKGRKFDRMNKAIAKKDPDFIVLGGDIAYTNSKRHFFKGPNWETSRWHDFFEGWKKKMVTSDGRLIPMLVVVGNHDISKDESDLFYQIFAFPEKGKAYRSVDFGYLSLLLLDSGHTFPIEGEQTKWLEESLKERENVPWKFPVYHIAAFPSAYSYTSGKSVQIRQHWVPLFEKYGIKTVFENHNHTYKRTFPIKEEKIDQDGVVYLGDGSWGVSPRTPKKAWYLDKIAKVNSVWLVTLKDDKALLESFNGHVTIENLEISQK